MVNQDATLTVIFPLDKRESIFMLAVVILYGNISNASRRE